MLRQFQKELEQLRKQLEEGGLLLSLGFHYPRSTKQMIMLDKS